jgi:hypothetical protein
MIEHIRPEFTQDILPTHLGYHLQLFRSGRAKISFQITPQKKVEFYADCPKRDRQGLLRQKKRSVAAVPKHFDLIATILKGAPDAKVFRLHEKGNNNKTADNAHLLLSVEQATLWLVMSEVTHQWELTTPLAQILLEAKGKRLGEASIFNEYMPTYEHDWEDAEFGLDDYKVGPRIPGEVATPLLPKTAAPKRPPAAKPVHRQEDEREDPSDPFFFTDQPCDDDEDVHSASALPKAPPASVMTDYVQDDPSDDPILFAELSQDPPEAVFPKQQNSQPQKTTSKGQSMMYGRDYLRAELGI